MKEATKQLELIAALLREETTLSLATNSENSEASVAPLFYIADEELSLYWLSSKTSLHSLNLKRTPQATAPSIATQEAGGRFAACNCAEQ